jgi:hypothetical protein
MDFELSDELLEMKKTGQDQLGFRKANRQRLTLKKT